MKMKLDYEYDETIVPSVIKALLPIVDRIMKTVERGQDMSLQRAIILRGKGSPHHEHLMHSEEDSEDDSDDSSEENTPPKPRVIPFPDTELDEEDEPPKESAGQVVLTDLLHQWVINFDEEGEQPDRLQLLGDITQVRKLIVPLLGYCKEVGGLTRAVHRCLLEVEGNADPERSRIIASNICQVASCVCPPLADQFKYPNPLLED